MKPSRLTLSTFLALGSLLAACSSAPITPPAITTQSTDLPAGMPRDPDNYIYTADFVDGEMVYSSAPLPEGSYRPAEYYDHEVAREEPIADQTIERIDPRLYDIMADTAYEAGDMVEVSLLFEDTLTLPYFYRRDPTQPNDSRYNQDILAKNETLAAAIREARAPIYERFTSIIQDLGGKVLFESMLSQLMIVEVPHDSLKEIISLSEVRLFIAPSNEAPAFPQSPTVADARQLLKSDSYFTPYGFNNLAPIALIDSEVRTTHQLLQGRINNSYECYLFSAQPGDLCDPISNPATLLDPCNHGTSSAGIIVGNLSQSINYRGLTSYPINSYNVDVATVTQNCGSELAAFLRAMNSAAAQGDKIIVANVGFTDSFSRAAVNEEVGKAFDAGMIVVAAAGNNGFSGVTSPGDAHKALAVGAFLASNGTQYVLQGRGPASDGRVKPDIQAPSFTYTASSQSNTARRNYSGTSGATPYAGAVAALLTQRLRDRFNIADSGHVYAHMIAFGDFAYPFNRTNGAGKLEMPSLGAPFRFGKVTLSPDQTVTVNLPNTAGNAYGEIRAAIWWPEDPEESNQPSNHNVIDLFLKNPSGSSVASSLTVNSVFEKVRHINFPIQQGTWQMEIRSAKGNPSSQQVYWAAYLLPQQ